MKIKRGYLITGLLLMLSSIMKAEVLKDNSEQFDSDPGFLSEMVYKQSRRRRLADCSTSTFSANDYT